MPAHHDLTAHKPNETLGRLATLLAGALALAYLALPPLLALHQAQHLSEQLAASDHRTHALAATAAGDADKAGSCEICQSAARSKHTGALTNRTTALLHLETRSVFVARHEPRTLGGRSPPSVRAPPLA